MAEKDYVFVPSKNNYNTKDQNRSDERAQEASSQNCVASVDICRSHSSRRSGLHKSQSFGERQRSTSRLPVPIERTPRADVPTEDCDCPCHYSRHHSCQDISSHVRNSRRYRSTQAHRNSTLSSSGYVADVPVKFTRDFTVVHDSGETMYMPRPGGGAENGRVFYSTGTLARASEAEGTEGDDADGNIEEVERISSTGTPARYSEDERTEWDDTDGNIAEVERSEGHQDDKVVKQHQINDMAVQTDFSPSDDSENKFVQSTNKRLDGGKYICPDTGKSMIASHPGRAILVAAMLCFAFVFMASYLYCMVTTRATVSIPEVLLDWILEQAGHREHLSSCAWKEFQARAATCFPPTLSCPWPIRIVVDWTKNAVSSKQV